MFKLISDIPICIPPVFKIAPIYSRNGLHIPTLASQDISLPWSSRIPEGALLRSTPSPTPPKPPPPPSLPSMPPLVRLLHSFLMFQQNSWESWGLVACFQEQSACSIIHHFKSLLCKRRPPSPSWYWVDERRLCWLIQAEQVRPALSAPSHHLQGDEKSDGEKIIIKRRIH